MDPTLYRAAMEGKVEILLQNSHQFDVQMTPNGNTLVHIAAMFGKDDCVAAILRNFPSLLTRSNVNGKTALHVAARQGHLAATRAIVALASEEHETSIFRLTDNDGNTALHEAVQFRHPDVVKLLVEQDPEFPHRPNKANETPLYLAAGNGLDDCVSTIIRTCKSSSFSGPGGRNALHAAVIFNSQESTTILLHWKPILSEAADEVGWTPLHYAANLGHVERVGQLLNFNRYLAYATTDNGEMTTSLHLAASRGHVNVIQEIISHCPDCCEMVNRRGENFLHTALENNTQEVINFILETPMLMSLISQQDNEGNTPNHLLEASKCRDLLNSVTNPIPRLDFDKNPSQSIIADSENNYEHDSNDRERGITDDINMNIVKDQRITVNNEMITPSSSWNHQVRKNAKTKIEREYSQSYIEGTRILGETNLIVATLVATVAFTAGFTLPGGYNQGDETSSDEGMAVLARHTAFKAFIVTDTLALLFSTSAILIYLLFQVDEKREMLVGLIRVARNLTLLAVEAMMVAFVTGTYAVLKHQSALAIAVCVLLAAPIFSATLSLLFMQLVEK